MTKLSIITAEFVYTDVNDVKIPTIVLVGRDEQGKKRYYKTIFYPYFYISQKQFMEIKDHGFFDNHVREITGSEARTITHQSVTRIGLTDPRYTQGLVHTLHKGGKVFEGGFIYSYEADLSNPSMLPLRFLIDKGIKSGCDISDDGDITPIDFEQPLRVWYIDFEALSDKLVCSGPKKQDPIPIVTLYDSYEKHLYTLYVYNPNWIKEPKFTPENGWVHSVSVYSSEAMMLEALMELVESKDPDLITAWNLDRYDIIKWMQRMQACHIDPKLLSHFNSVRFKQVPYRIKGRITFDLMRGFKKFTDAELRSYSLGAVCEEEHLPHEKVPMTMPTQWIWDNDPQTMYRRNVNDVLILVALDKKYDLIQHFDDIRKEFGAMFSEVLVNHRVLDTALMRFVHGDKVLSTCRKADKPKDKYLGAVVIEPVPGIYHFIAGLDFGREYPSIIQMFNISPETYREKKGKNTYDIRYEKDGEVEEFHFVKSPRGILPQLIDEFFRKRDELEVEKIKAIEAKDEIATKKWDRRAYGVKKMTNAIYGVMDYPQFRLFRQECSEAVAVIGRISIEKIQKILANRGVKVVYGDTDSTFIQLETSDYLDALDEAQELQSYLNEGLKNFFIEEYHTESAPTGLGLKKIYNTFLSVSKKMYAGKSFWDEKKGFRDEWDFKGLEMIRSDSSAIEKVVLEKACKMILEGRYKEVDEIEKIALADIDSKKLSPLTMGYPLQISHPMLEYVKSGKLPAHVASAIYSNLYLNTDYTLGDKPMRLPVLIEKNHTEEQTTLDSPGVATGYPREFEYQGLTVKAKWISIIEDMIVPEFFMRRINYKAIHKRMEKKFKRLKDLIPHEET